MWWSRYHWVDTIYRQSKLTRILLRIAYFIDGVDLKAWRKKNNEPAKVPLF